MKISAAELSLRLSKQVDALVREILPQGHREGAEWVCPSLHGSSKRSLSIRLYGQKAGVWADFASGHKGDALGLVAMVLHSGDIKLAIDWSKKWLAVPDRATGSAAGSDRDGPSLRSYGTDDAAKRRAAQAVFFGAVPSLTGTPAAAYLAGRGLDLAQLGRQPRSLRYHPTLPNKECGLALPAMVAAITDVTGAVTGVHRTWLAQVDGRWRKAPLRNAKMSLGIVSGSAIRLWRGASGKALASAPADETIVIVEGIEDGLAAAILCPEFRILAAVSLSNLGTLELPPTVTTVVICADNDDGPAAKAGLERAIRRHVAAGRIVRIARSPRGKDFADLLEAEA